MILAKSPFKETSIESSSCAFRITNESGASCGIGLSDEWFHVLQCLILEQWNLINNGL